LEKNLSIEVGAIPADYCYENRAENYSELAVVRSERCNNTFIFNPPTCAVCDEPVICPSGEFGLGNGETRQFGDLSVFCAKYQECENKTEVVKELYCAVNESEQNLSCTYTSVRLCVENISSNDEALMLLRGDGEGYVRLKENKTLERLDNLQVQISGPNGYTEQLRNKEAELQGWKDGSKGMDMIAQAITIIAVVAAVFMIWRKGTNLRFGGVSRPPNPERYREMSAKFDEAFSKK
jgi:hypothetical protein